MIIYCFNIAFLLLINSHSCLQELGIRARSGRCWWRSLWTKCYSCNV